MVISGRDINIKQIKWTFKKNHLCFAVFRQQVNQLGESLFESYLLNSKKKWVP